jgi:predicted DNA-binding transcriptional regulator AlpA
MSKEQLELFTVSMTSTHPSADRDPSDAKPPVLSTAGSKADKGPEGSSPQKSKRPAEKRPAKTKPAKGNPSVYLTVQNVATRYGVCVPTIWRWAKATPGFPAPVKLGPGTTRWPLETLLHYERGLQISRSKEEW